MKNSIKKKNKMRKNIKQINEEIRAFCMGIGLKATVIISALVITVCSVLGLIAYNKSSKVLYNNISNNLQDRVIDNAEIVGARVMDYIKEVEGLASKSEVRSMDWETQKNVLDSEAIRLGYKKFGVADVLGRAQFTDGKTAHVSDKEYFKRALEGRPSITAPSLEGTDMVINIIVPIKDPEGKFLGILQATADCDRMYQLVKDVKVGETGYAYIIDSESTIIAHPNMGYVSNQYNILREAEEDEKLQGISETVATILAGT